MYLIDLPFKNKIKKSTSVETSLKVRKSLKIVRIVTTIFLIALLWFVCLIISVVNNLDGNLLAMTTTYAIVRGWFRLKGNVQINSKERYLSRHDDFILYLRAFEADFYDKSPQSHSFESCLAKAIKKRGANICAIGMTKELDAPVGAERVYVADESWQKDVSELMQKAKMIFILMSDRQSCIWEITQGAKMLNKICFIFDDIDKYERIKNDKTHNIPFPEFEIFVSKLGDKQLDKASDFENRYIGFMINGSDLEAFTFSNPITPQKINTELDKIQQIRNLL